MDKKKTPLLGLTLDELQSLAIELGFPKFVGKQIADWMYRKHVRSIDEMTNLSKVARERLNEHYIIGCSDPVDSQKSVDGTIKYLYRTTDGHYIETVFIPTDDRATLCVSSQVGCKMNCQFCMTGRQGYMTSLPTTEIINQIYSLPERDRLTNIVYMGQGEPFDNLDNVLRSTKILTETWGYGWSPTRITVSTIGLPQGLLRFLEDSRCHLAISLHHPFPEERAKIMPIEKAFSIEQVVALLKQYDFCRRRPMDIHAPRQRRLSFEYIVFGGMNDSIRHAQGLVDLLCDLDCRINLIRFHTIPDTSLQGTDEDALVKFRDYLTAHGLFATIRASRGEDIFAACGLLTTKKQEEEHRSQTP